MRSQRELEAQPDRPLVVVGEPEGGVARVVAANRAALKAGIFRGMPRREAEGLCPIALVLPRDIGEEARRFEAVIEAVESVVPAVEVAEPGLLFVRIEGAVRYFGGEERLVELIEKELAVLGAVGRRLGLADGPFAARCAAEQAEQAPFIVADTAAFLADLDVGSLPTEELVATFRWLGLSTLGELARLPREALASRFGNIGLEAHRLASGEDRSVQPRLIETEWAVEGRYEEPLESLDQVGFASRALAARLMTRLSREGIAPHRITIDAEGADGTIRSRVWRSTDPFTEATLADRIWWQVRAWVDQWQEVHADNNGEGRIDRVKEGGGIVRLRLDPADLSGGGRQLALLEDHQTRLEAERALARAQSLVGPEAVLVSTPQGGRLPSERVFWRRWAEETTVSERDPTAPWPGATPKPSPALVPAEPHLLEVEWDEGVPVRLRLSSRWEPVLNWSGPWRLLGRWWKGELHADRYQLVTSAGAFLVVVRDGRSFLAGIYD